MLFASVSAPFTFQIYIYKKNYTSSRNQLSSMLESEIQKVEFLDFFRACLNVIFIKLWLNICIVYITFKCISIWKVNLKTICFCTWIASSSRIVGKIKTGEWVQFAMRELCFFFLKEKRQWAQVDRDVGVGRWSVKGWVDLRAVGQRLFNQRRNRLI